MSCLGVHFALSDEDVAALRAAASEEERLNRDLYRRAAQEGGHVLFTADR